LKGDQWGFLPGPGAGIAGVTSVRATGFLIISAGGCAWRAALDIAATKFEAGGGGRRPASQEGGPENLAARSAVSSSMVSQRRSIRSGGGLRLGVEAWPFEVGQQRRQPREADEKFARARMVLGGHGVEPVQGGEDGVDVATLHSCATAKVVRRIRSTSRSVGGASAACGQPERAVEPIQVGD